MKKPKIITAVVIDGYTYRTAEAAARNWALLVTSEWWTNDKGSRLAASQRYERPLGYVKMDEYNRKVYRRVLPIFKKILPQSTKITTSKEIV